MTTMRLASVDLPHAVLDAQQEGRLVIFAGAGVSIPRPSRLPSFKVLAKKIAHGTIAIERNEPLDHFLGRAEMEGCDVQKKAREILSRPSSKPNIFHESFVSIFSDPSLLRIVTTNFDLHFEFVIRKRWPDAETTIYHAPALPQGNDFSGLVYLHGRLQAPGRLILTDQDFGQAYLTRGWARRFLQDLFEKYTVLFVGYSHQDVVMNYLARGLPPKTKPTRYILTPYGGRQWEYLGIEAIVYEADKTHSRLQEFGRVWAEESRLGVLERETQIQQIVHGDPTTLTRENEDRLLYTLGRPAWAQYFFRHADAPGWLDWADSHGVLNTLFGSPSPDIDAADVSDWLCRDPLGARGSTAARIASLRKGPLHPVLWRALGDRLWRAAMETPDRTPEQSKLLTSWLPILVHREP
ncbi:MAG TPA: SIR2 family protein, partial [Thermoanaerobaculia bacterium]|nr:SIR2 family protein [Thermoanaerobaculia bacterium]